MREVINNRSDETSGLQGIPSTMDEIALNLIQPFKNHPFKVQDDDKMQDLVESVLQQGILSPVIVRPIGNGKYEMISGHRRMHAAQKAKLKKIPAIIMELTDDEATIVMVDSNFHREEILPSERAFSLKMKMDAMRHQGTCRHDVDKLDPVDRKSATIVGEGSGLTGRSVHRYIKLTALLPELLALVDQKQLSLVNGVEISNFGEEVQRFIYEYIKKNGGITPQQISVLKKQPNLENLTPYTVMTILKEAGRQKNASRKVSFTEKRLNQYFPEDYSASKRERIIIELLEKWKEEQEPSEKG